MYPIVTVTVSPRCRMIEYVETADGFRRLGYAKELCEALTRHYRTPLTGVADSPSGEQLINSLQRVGAFREFTEAMADGGSA